MTNPLIFISYTASDEEIATKFGECLSEAFLGQFDFFVSAVDIDAGSEWRKVVHEKLQECVLLIVIATSRSAHRAWINYEVGAASVQDKTVIAVVSPDYSHQQLPSTYDTRQAVNASNSNDLTKLLRALNNHLPGRKVPRYDFSEFIAFFANFEKRAKQRNELIEIIDESGRVQARLPEWLKQTGKTAILCGTHFQKSLSDHRGIYQDAISRGVKFTFGILDPESPDIAAVAESFAMDAEELRLECRSGLRMLMNLRNEAKDLIGSKTECIEIFVMKSKASARYYVFDENQADGIVACTFYVDIRSSVTPTYVYGAGHEAAAKYVQACKEVIKRTGVKLD
jgi:hypothetical protein